MITQLVNQIEHHPESLYVQAEVTARMKQGILNDVTGWFHSILAFWRRFFVRRPANDRNERIQCGGMEQGCKGTL